MTLAVPSIVIPQAGQPYETVRHSFRRGLNTSISEESISLDELSAAENYIPDILNSGVVIKREGITAASTSQSEAFTSVHQGKNANYASTSTVIVSFAGSSLASSLTSATQPDWATFVGNDIFVNGTDVKTSTNGSSFGTLSGSPPTFKYIAVHNNLLFGAGHSTGILRWADLGTVSTWTATNALTLTNDENNGITGLAHYNNVLMVFFKYGFAHVTGFATREISVVLNRQYSVGCTSHTSIIPTDKAIYWWSDNGPVMSRDGVEIIYVGLPKIAGTLDTLNKGAYATVHGAWDSVQQRVSWYVPEGSAQTTMNRRLDYYYNDGPEGTWWVQTGTAAQMGASGRAIISGAPRVYAGTAATSGYLYYNDATVATDAGSPISAFLETGRNSPLSPIALHRLRRLGLQTVLIANATVDYSVFLDNDQTASKTWNLQLSAAGGFVLNTSTLGTGVLGSGAVPNEVTIGYAQKFHKIKHRISDDGVIRTRMRSILNDGYAIHG